VNGPLQQIDSKNLPKSLDILKWAIKEDFSGYDPYDGLNLPILEGLPLLKNKYLLTFITQFFKNFPINLRPFLGIKKERNAKGIALFIFGLLNLYELKKDEIYLKISYELINWLIENKSSYTNKFAWGYNFPWQSRNSFKPRYYPNIVTTSFVAHSFIDIYEKTGNIKYLNVAISSADFIIEELNIYEDERGICFSYSPSDAERIYNASLLGAWLLIRVWNFTKINKYIDFGKKSVMFVINSQNRDGSWYYGDNENQKWIDNFHTGYNLWSLLKIDKIKVIEAVKESICKGLDYYISNLFNKDMVPKYFLGNIYPIDIHSFAVSMIVLKEARYKELSRKIFKNAVNLLYSGKDHFYFRKTAFWINKIPYVRWSNAWMFYAMTEMEKYENMD